MHTYNPPKGVAESWFLLTCGGEVYETKIVRGSELLDALLQMMWGNAADCPTDEVEGYAHHLSNPDSWYTNGGDFTGWRMDLEDGAIEFSLIRDFGARVEVERRLIALARAAWSAMDNGEEAEGADGRVSMIPGDDYDAMSDAMDALDDLPELPAPYVGNGPAKAEHALGLNTTTSQPAPSTS